MAHRYYNKDDFKKGDLILYEYDDGEYLRGEIVELKNTYALIEIALPCKKNEEIPTEIIDAKYSEIIPFSKVFIDFAKKRKDK